jgi:glycerol-3-phosphate dehydrogenase
VLIGTTDVPVESTALEPRPLKEELDFLLGHAARYLSKDPRPADVLSVFSGLRPLVRAGDGRATKALSRDHTIHITPSGLVTIAGGKWTTYRKMAEDAIDQAASLAGLEMRPCITRELPIHGHAQPAMGKAEPLAAYGADAPAVRALIHSASGWDRPLHPRLPYRAGEVVWAVRQEMARTVEDVLARRTRALVLDARAAVEAAPLVAELMARELRPPDGWRAGQVRAFEALAAGYVLD